jgi:PAS domain S-box-containing protein
LALTNLSARIDTLLRDLERGGSQGEGEDRRLLRETLRLLRDDLRQRDEEHRRADDRFRLAVEAAKLGIWDWDMVTGRVAWNSHHAQIFGLEPAQFEGDYNAFMRCVHPEDQAKLAAAIAAARNQRDHFDHVYRICLPDGAERWVRSKGGCHHDAGGRAIRMTGTVVDVTEQIRGKLLAESELRYRTLHRRLAALMDALPVGVSFSEDATCERISANREGLAMFEVPAEENLSASAPDPDAPGRKIQFFHAGKPVTDRELPLQRAVAENRIIPPMELEVILPGGRRWYTDASGAPIRDEQGNVISGVSVMVDVTERKRTEEELRLGRAQMEMVVKGASVGVWYCPLPFNTLFWDATVKEHFHLPPDAAVTIDLFYERIHPEDRERTRMAIEASIGLRQPYDIDYRTVSADGQRVHWIRASGRGFYDDAGNPIRFDGITIDVTARKHVEEELRTARQNAEQARAQAEAASKAKDHFLAVLSHELRTPLTPVLTAAEMLTTDPTLSADQRDTLQMIRRNVELEARLIDDLLDITRISHHKLELRTESIDLHQKIAHVINICRQDALEKGVSLESDLTATNAHLRADPARFQQIIWNLLKNAIKFTPAGGRVSIRSENATPGRIRIIISDTGVGIDAIALPSIFDAFEQGGRAVTREFGGLGLGLAISRALAELHGGTITAASPGLGRGATFTVDMPVAVNPAQHLPPSGGVNAPQKLSCSILLVEDHADSRRALTKLLTNLGCKVQSAGTVAEALAVLAQSRFDLIISDLGLPDADGTELMRRAKPFHAGKGIALSGYGMDADVARCREAGFDAHLTKPVNFKTLEGMIRQLTCA